MYCFFCISPVAVPFLAEVNLRSLTARLVVISDKCTCRLSARYMPPPKRPKSDVRWTALCDEVQLRANDTFVNAQHVDNCTPVAITASRTASSTPRCDEVVPAACCTDWPLDLRRRLHSDGDRHATGDDVTGSRHVTSSTSLRRLLLEPLPPTHRAPSSSSSSYSSSSSSSSAAAAAAAASAAVVLARRPWQSKAAYVVMHKRVPRGKTAGHGLDASPIPAAARRTCAASSSSSSHLLSSNANPNPSSASSSPSQLPSAAPRLRRILLNDHDDDDDDAGNGRSQRPAAASLQQSNEYRGLTLFGLASGQCSSASFARALPRAQTVSSCRDHSPTDSSLLCASHAQFTDRLESHDYAASGEASDSTKQQHDTPNGLK